MSEGPRDEANAKTLSRPFKVKAAPRGLIDQLTKAKAPTSSAGETANQKSKWKQLQQQFYSKGFVHDLEFPEYLCGRVDTETLLRNVNKFLQEHDSANGHEPLFHKDEYVLFIAKSDSGFGPTLRDVAPELHSEQPATDSEMESSGPMLEFHTDTYGTYPLFEACLSASTLFERLLVLITYAEISNSIDPCKRLREAGIFTGNMWWVLDGTRKLSCISREAFAKLTNGKSIMECPAQESETNGLAICQNLDVLRMLAAYLFDPAVSDETIRNVAEVCLAPRGKGSLFNSGIVFHRGSAKHEFVGASMEVRFVAVPIAFLNEVSGSKLDKVPSSDAGVDSLKPIAKSWLDMFNENERAHHAEAVSYCCSAVESEFKV